MLEDSVDAIVEKDQLTAQNGYKVYSLCAVLDYPANASLDACLTRLLLKCRDLHGTTDYALQALSDVLIVIAGACFGQDLVLKERFSEQDVVL